MKWYLMRLVIVVKPVLEGVTHVAASLNVSVREGFAVGLQKTLLL